MDDKTRKTQTPPQAASLDVEAFSRNLARLIDEGGKALAAYLKPREEGKIKNDLAQDLSEIVGTLSQVAEYWLSDPQRALELQSRLGGAYLELWGNTAKRLAGEPAPPVAEPSPRDKRFADPEWKTNQFFDFLKQAYLLTSEWADRLVKEADNLDPHTKQKAEFYTRQIANAISPSNFVLTNPELLRETFASNAERIWCAACTCSQRIFRPGPASCASASLIPPPSSSGAISRRLRARSFTKTS
jgi:polyhydroxyalkanoate synthase subunit PhaC